MTDEPQVVSTGLTARVADSYGANPHEHKPSQDPFAPDVDLELAEAKQAATGDARVDDDVLEKAAQPYPDGEEESSPGSSSSTSRNETESSERKTASDSTPARTTESPSEPDPKGSSTARSTGTGRSGSSGRRSDR